MTKTEYGKCVKLMEEAIRNIRKSQLEYEKANGYFTDSEKREDIEQRANQHYGYAEGIKQALVTLGFKHNRMKELSELL